MSNQNEARKLVQVGIIAAFATLAFIGTIILRIPIPATGGYFNLGDTFVMIAGLLYGPWIGGLVGMIGPAAADAVGYPPYIFATAVVKGFEGLVVGYLSGGRKSGAIGRTLAALIAGIFIIVGGYYLFEAVVYPALAGSIPFFGVTDPKAALAEIVPNLLQGGISAVIAFGIWRVFRRKAG
jgi:uncharacterized membrane protein